MTKALRHLAECFVGLPEFARRWIDKRDPDRHVGENFFVEDNFALDPPGGFGLAAIKNSAEPGEHCREQH